MILESNKCQKYIGGHRFSGFFVANSWECSWLMKRNEFFSFKAAKKVFKTSKRVVLIGRRWSRFEFLYNNLKFQSIPISDGNHCCSRWKLQNFSVIKRNWFLHLWFKCHTWLTLKRFSLALDFQELRMIQGIHYSSKILNFNPDIYWYWRF